MRDNASAIMRVDELAYRVLDKYIYIQSCENGYDYSIYNDSYLLLDGGVYDNPETSIFDVAKEIIAEITDKIVECAVSCDAQKLQENVEKIENKRMSMTQDMLLLILGNVDDDVALANICEAQSEELSDLDEEAADFLIETNMFYRNQEEFERLHQSEGTGEFEAYLEDGTLTKTIDGYVWTNCV